jgi:hypothetical protein
MEFIEMFEKTTNTFASKIKESKYLESTVKNVKNTKHKCKDICEIIIGSNEIEYSSLSIDEKENFIRNKKLEIASAIEIPDKKTYITKWKTKLIQNGFQTINSMSSILLLNEKYKVNTIIYNGQTNKYYKTTLKNYDPLYCRYDKGSWDVIENQDIKENQITTDIKDLDNILQMDIDTIFIYTSFLGSLSKYKMSDLEIVAKQENIDLSHPNGKKKLKKDIYDEINLKHYIQDI